MKIKLPKKLQKTIQDKDIEYYEFEDEDDKLIKTYILKDSFIKDNFYIADLCVEFCILNDTIGEFYGYISFNDTVLIETDSFFYKTKQEIKKQYKECFKALINKYKKFLKGFFEEKNND